MSECSGERKGRRKRRKGLYKKMAAQMEFYFSDANLRKSKFLMELIQKDPWVPLTVFDKFNKIKAMMAELEGENVEEQIIKALEVSKTTCLRLNSDRTAIQRTAELVEKADEDECTIYIENLDPDSNHDSVKRKFEEFGGVAYVSIPKYKNSQTIKGFAFVEFEQKESVQKALQSFGQLEKAEKLEPSLLLSVKTYNEELKESQKENKEGSVNGSSNPTKSANTDNANTDRCRLSLKRSRQDPAPANDDEEYDDEDAPKRLRIDEKSETGGGGGSGGGGAAASIKGAGSKAAPGLAAQGGEPERVEEGRGGSGVGGGDRREVMEVEAGGGIIGRGDEAVEEGGGEEDDGQLRIMTKTEWKRLRNKYLNDQRKNMAAAKAYLRKKQSEPFSHRRQKPNTGTEAGNSGRTREVARPAEPEQPPPPAAAASAEPQMTPGLLVRVGVESGIDDVKAVKKQVRELQDVGYIDATIGQTSFYVRCHTPEQAVKLVESKLDTWQAQVLKGEEERNYWQKIEKDKKEKRSGKVVVPKVKSKKRLLTRIEEAKNSHVYFGD